MKLSHLVIASAAAVSLSAVAADEQKQRQQPGAQSSQQSASGGASASQRGQHMSQETVRQVQQALKDEGHDLQVDGMMGPKTQAALKEYQQSKGMPATGQLNQQTLSALGVSESGSAATGGTARQPGASSTPRQSGSSGAGGSSASGGGSSSSGALGGSSSPGQSGGTMKQQGPSTGGSSQKY